MADSDKLAAVVAELAVRDEEFKPFERVKLRPKSGEPVWPLSELKGLLGYRDDESIDSAVNRAKILASKAGIPIREHFCDGTLFDHPSEICITKYAAILITMSADVRKEQVALANSYFALQIDRQHIEDEKRLRGRLDVATENRKLAGEASRVGVQNFPKFNGIGVSALYGNLDVKQIAVRKGLRTTESYLDYAGSEELAANLFRITQTAAALRRQEEIDERRACETHRTVAKGVRDAIKNAGNIPPEALPPAKTKIGRLATQVKHRLASSRQSAPPG